MAVASERSLKFIAKFESPSRPLSSLARSGATYYFVKTFPFA